MMSHRKREYYCSSRSVGWMDGGFSWLLLLLLLAIMLTSAEVNEEQEEEEA